MNATFLVFAAIIGLTMYVTYVASKRVKSAADYEKGKVKA
jgi:Na+(H+)/acetate symporter ActP